MKWLATMVMVYMLAALCWWSALLLKQNEVIYHQSVQVNTSLDQATIEKAHAKREKQKRMIYGEGLVFGCSLLLGIYLIYRASRKEIDTTKKQHNFLLSFSHELKSPLTSINLSLDTIKKRTLNDHTKEDICNIALKESKRLETLIDAILMVAKIDDFTIVKSPIDVHKVIEEIVQTMSSTGELKNVIQIHNHSQETIINADTHSVRSIMNNLIENAVKYGNNGAIDITLSDKDRYIQIEVADHGIGIADEHKLRVFDRFYRVGDESVRKSKGTGLGLYIVKKMVDAHQGKIAIIDNPVRGTIFSILLPR